MHFLRKIKVNEFFTKLKSSMMESVLNDLTISLSMYKSKESLKKVGLDLID